MGLHSNAEIGYYTQAAKDMWTHLIDLQPQTGVVWHLLSFFPLNLFQKMKVPLEVIFIIFFATMLSYVFLKTVLCHR